MSQSYGAAALVNLAGRTVDCIKTPDHCDEILCSRVEATEVLGQAVRRVQSPPPVWVQMATAHRYGDPPDRVCDEDAAFGYGLAPFVGHAWEEALCSGSASRDAPGYLANHFCARTRRRRPCLDSPAWCAGPGREGWPRAAGNQLDTPAGHEPADRPGHIRPQHEGRVSGATAPYPVSNAEFMAS